MNSNVLLFDIDTRILEEDYKGYHLLARYTLDGYVGTIDRLGDLKVKFEGAALDPIMISLKQIVDLVLEVH